MEATKSEPFGKHLGYAAHGISCMHAVEACSCWLVLSWCGMANQTNILPKSKSTQKLFNFKLQIAFIKCYASFTFLALLSCKRCFSLLQNDLRMAKEKARRKQAIIGRQEEELAGREASLDSMRKEQAGSSRQVDHLQEDNQALKVHFPFPFPYAFLFPFPFPAKKEKEQKEKGLHLLALM